jgi:mannosyltransferase
MNWAAEQYALVRQVARYSLSTAGFIVGLEAILAAGLALVRIGDKSFWVDEGFSYAFVKLDWSDLWDLLTEREANQGLYYLVLKPWLTLGENESVIRVLSASFAVATIPITYALGARLFGTRLGLVAGLLMAVNGFFVQYAQEARAYSLLLLLVSASSLLFVTCLEKPSRARWIAYASVSALAAYAHFFAVLLLAGHAASLLFLGRSNAPWKSFLAAAGLVSLLLIPLGLFVLFKDDGQIDWIARPTLRESVAQLVRLAGGEAPAVAYFVACTSSVIVTVRVWSTSRTSQEAWRYAFLLSWLLVPIGLVLSISQFEPIVQTRYLIICLPPLVILASLGVCQLQNRLIFVAALSLFVVFSFLGVVEWYVNGQKDDWRSTTAYVLSESQPEDAVIFFLPRINSPFDYYRSRLGTTNDNLTYVDYATGMVVPRGSVEGSGTYEASETLTDSLRGRFGRVWLVLSFDAVRGDPRRGETSQRIQDSMQQDFRLILKEEFRGVRVQLYDIP